MELILKSAEINLPQSIANLEALKEELTPKLEKYNNLVVTADSIKAAKADKAALNKLKAAIEDQRKAIKKQYLEPYMVLETQCKEVVALIDAPISAIDKQIKVFDEIEEKEKYTELEETFLNCDPPDWIELDDVLNPKWRNKTLKAETLKTEITEAVKALVKDFDKISGMYAEAPYLPSIKQHFMKNKDFSKSAVYAAELTTAYKREAELKEKMLQAAAEAKANQAAEPTENTQTAQEATTPEPSVITPTETQNAPAVNSGTSQKLLKGKFEVEGTAEQIKALGQFMKANNIKFVILK